MTLSIDLPLILTAAFVSSAGTGAGYLRLRRWFDGAFAALFAGASLKILTARLAP